MAMILDQNSITSKFRKKELLRKLEKKMRVLQFFEIKKINFHECLTSTSRDPKCAFSGF